MEPEMPWEDVELSDEEFRKEKHLVWDSDAEAWISNNNEKWKSLLKLTLDLPNDIRKIPESIGDLLHLNFLKIIGNKSINSLPDCITRLPNLQVLHLCYFTNLKQLAANLNELDSLREIRISLSPIISLPDTITRLPNLQVLYLHCCFSLQELPNLNDLVSLRELKIDNAKFISLPDTITRLPSLQVLHLIKCHSLQELPTNLNELVSLSELKIEGSKIISVPDSITRLPNLQVLHLHWCHSLQELPTNLNELVSLKELEILGSEIIFLPDSITRLPNLQVLHLHMCDSFQELPTNLNELVNMRKLQIRGSQIKYLPNTITRLHNLQILSLCYCWSLEELPTSLNNLVSLKELDIVGTRINFIPNGVTGLLNLKLLHLPYCFSIQQLHAIFHELVKTSEHQLFVGCRKITNLQDIQNLISQNMEIRIYGFDADDGRNVVSDELMEPLLRELMEEPDHQDDEIYLVGQNSNHPLESEHVNLMTSENDNRMVPVYRDAKAKQKRKISLEDIKPFFGNKTLKDAAEKLGVARSTIRSICRENEILEWPPSTSKRGCPLAKKQKRDPESTSKSKSSQEDPGTPTSPVGCEQVMEMNMLPHETTMASVNETTMTNQTHLYSNEGGDESGRSGARPEDDRGSSTFVVKAMYKEDTIRFDCPCTSGFVVLEEEVGKALKLEPSKFKIKYQDDDNEWMLMTRDSDVQLCLRLSRSSGKNVVRLSVHDL